MKTNPGVPVTEQVVDIQVSTQQVPCGRFSIFDTTFDMTEFERAVYLAINEKSNWDSGISHALSYKRLAELLGVKHRSQVIRAVRSLIKKGWLRIEGKRKTDGAHIYKVIHHNCKPEEIPLDSDNRAQKCAVPRGEGSASDLVEKGKLDWRGMVQWFVQKVNSDWTTGVVEMTVRKANDLLNFSLQTICNNVKKLIGCGLLERLSGKNEGSVFQLFPKPYPERRDRAEYDDNTKLPYIDGWYYSYNRLWRFKRDSLCLQKKTFDGKWFFTEMRELFDINPKIWSAFFMAMEHISTIRKSFSSA